MNKQESIKVGVGILVGLAVGCTIGLLVAPKSGKETREWIVDEVSNIKGKVVETTSKVKDKVTRAVDELKK